MLFVVSTPIGNLKDITLRALETLKSVDLVAAEDTRHSGILLKHYQIDKPLTSYHSYNRIKKAEELLVLLKQGKSVALISDSGTPGISDPGSYLIRLSIDNGIAVSFIPGPTALIAALVLSGLPTQRFSYEGFLPVKQGRRISRLKELAGEERTVIIYESCHRLLKLLSEVFSVMGDVEIACARELTKQFEEVRRGKVKEILEYFKNKKPRGEFVIVVGPQK
ncbi:MAG: 16S rRNA (cytidine(1402)-2'-O)-methyltransferase [Candidatus Omnitrophica bacterium]|nr:16S rRNA (cytidine(1402)-2'-O)-methyltransferase [Candidatus Omnitrophota bacterium]MDD5236138.1 16S rRNA (cytidine(1402)-2'-O)-methyltransferase [Candidatus Omnitrophota bacterium]MDD5611144.1 16S rRNA (cytidine(1402)-2'-O)-methyltransferase [Candidatus Omnitrophota bacterium]